MCPNRRMRNEAVFCFFFKRGAASSHVLKTRLEPPVISSGAEANSRRKYSSKCTHIWGRLKLKANSCRPACRTVSPSSGQSSSVKHKEDVFFHTPALRLAQKRHLLHKGRITSPQRVYLRLLEACKKRIQSRVSTEKTPTSELRRAVFTSETSLFMQISASEHEDFLLLYDYFTGNWIFWGFRTKRAVWRRHLGLWDAGEDIFNLLSVIAQIHGRVSHVK